MSDRKLSPRRGYPLSILFLLTGVCATVFTLIGLLVHQDRPLVDLAKEIIGSVIVWTVALMVLGLIIGLFHHARLRGALWGVLVGWFLGMCFGPLLFIPPKAFPLVLLTSVIGSAVLIACATVIRLNSAVTRAADGEQRPALTPPKPHPLDPDP